MKFQTARSQRRHKQDGSALILALVLITVLGVFLAAVLSFTSTGLKTTKSVRSQRSRVYSADGAVQATIQNMRNNQLLGGLAPFSGGDCNFTLPATNGSAVDVVCVAQAGSGVPTSGVPVTLANTPRSAILTLATSGDGISDSKNHTLPIGGPVFSNSGLSLSNPTHWNVKNGSVTARLSCNRPGNVTFTPASYGPANCPPPSPKAAVVGDPDYPMRSDAPATPGPVQNVPVKASFVCNTVGTKKLAVFQPGSYSNATNLNDAMDKCDATYFASGVYYFDFTVGTDLRVPDNKPVIAGDPHGWNPTTGIPPGPGPARRCKSHLDGPGPGAEFIFGNTSRLDLNKDGDFEICAWRDVDEQQIAIRGMNKTIGAYRVNTAGTNLVTTHNSGHSNLAVRGTFYAPVNDLDLTVKNSGGIAIDRGVIANRVNIDINPAAGFVDGISIPSFGDFGLLADREVLLTASIGGDDKLEALVKIQDSNAGVASVGYAVHVKRWRVIR